MNNARKIAAVGLAFLLDGHLGATRAQNIPETPTPPYVATVPEFFQWTIVIDDKTQPAKSAGGSPPPFALVKMVCTRTKEVKRDGLYFNNGRSSEIWHYKQYVLIKAANGEITIETLDESNPGSIVPDVSTDGFVGVDCVSLANFRGKKKLPSGQDVFLYSGFYYPPAASPGFDENGKVIPQQTIKVPADAMIAADTHLPVVTDRDTRTFTYSYQAPPTEMLELPAEIQKRLGTIFEREKFVEKMRIPPRR